MAVEEERIQDLLYQYTQLLGVQQIWWMEWQELADYILPRKNSIAVQRIPGYKRTQRLFDSTAPHDMELLASAIHGTLTPSFTKWFALEIIDEDLQKDYAVRTWLDAVNNRMRIEINKSNFNAEGHELYIDMCCFGTGCLYEEEAKEKGWWGGLRFSSVSIQKFVVAEGPDNRVDTVFRTIPMSTHAIKAKWPSTIPQEVVECPKPDELWEVIHAVVPKQSGNNQDYRWESTYILNKTRTILSTKGYYEFPFMVPRWTKYADETYGRGPSHTALPDIRTLNKIVEMELRNLAKNVDPPLGVVSGEVIGPARMIPGGITMLKSGRESLFPIDTTGKYEVVNLKKEELKQSIHGMYYIDQLQLQTGPQMTATEVNVRYETMQRVLGPTLGRIDTEFATPLIDRTFKIMYRAGLFNPLPGALVQALRTKPLGLRIQYEGPLARAQRSSDLTATDQFIQGLEPIAKLHPDVIDVIDFDELARYRASVLGIPSDIIRDAKQLDVIRQQKQQAMEQEKQNQEAMQVTQGAKNLSPAVRSISQKPQSGSPLEQLQGGAQGGRA